MTEGMKRIMRELEGGTKEEVLNQLLEENQNAKEIKKLRLSSDINNLFFVIQNPGVKPGGVKPEDFETYESFSNSLN